MMKKNILNIFLILYVFVFLGLVFHTSRNPQILGKYSLKYFFVLIVLFLLFFLFRRLLISFLNFSVVKFRKKKFRLNPLRKTIIIILLFVIIIAPFEIYLREKYKDYESNSYSFTIEHLHPFLQGQLVKDEELHVNSMGFRSDEISARKEKNTFRIVVFGGSTVLNREVTYEKNAARLLEKRLQNEYPNKKIEVINAGKDGYTTEHSLIQYLFNVQDLSPDMIIMWHGINDLLMSCTTYNNGRIAFKRDYSNGLGPIARMATQYFTPEPVVEVKLISGDFLLKALKDNLYSDFILPSIDTSVESRAKSYLAGGEAFIDTKDFPSIDTYRRNLKNFIEIAKKDNVAVVIGDQASLYDETITLDEARKMVSPSFYCRKNNKIYSLKSIKYGLEAINKVTYDTATENYLPFVHLSKNVPGTLDYFIDGVHYTEKGNEVIASQLFETIKQKNLIN